MTPFDPVRGFDGMRKSKTNIKGYRSSLASQEKDMWRRVLENIPAHKTVYYAASTPDIARIGYGRQMLSESDAYDQSIDSSWLKVTLEDFYTRVADANPEAPLNEVLASVLYYYEQQYAAIEE